VPAGDLRDRFILDLSWLCKAKVCDRVQKLAV
jgi:hypothetical protein